MGKKIAVAGATGAVGREILECLEERDFPVDDIRLLASERSVGKVIPFQGREISVELLEPSAFEGMDIALFSAGGETSLKIAPAAADQGCIVIDNSSAFRMDEEVPLVVPELNPQDVENAPRGIIANPNCTTIVTLMGLEPLHRLLGLKSMIVSSYQAVSGSGAPGIAELDSQMKAMVEGQEPKVEVYPRQIVCNVIPQVEPFLENGYSKEEMKMQNESRKILHAPELKASTTCVRVPVYRSHSVSVCASFEKAVDVDAARKAIEEAPGVELMDDPVNNVYPTPLDTTGKDNCLVGRIRKDLSLDNALSLWIVGDQVRKGAALNAVQIAELLV